MRHRMIDSSQSLPGRAQLCESMRCTRCNPSDGLLSWGCRQLLLTLDIVHVEQVLFDADSWHKMGSCPPRSMPVRGSPSSYIRSDLTESTDGLRLLLGLSVVPSSSTEGLELKEFDVGELGL